MREWPGRPLLGTATGRRWAVTLLGTSLILVTVLSSLVAHQSTPDGFDRAVDSPVIAWLGGSHGLLGWLAFPGTPLPAAAVTLVLVAACLRARRLNGAILAFAAVPVSTALDEELLKPLVHRTYLGAFAFPSGHTTTAMALTTTMALLYFARQSPREDTRPEGKSLSSRRSATVLRVLSLALALALTCIVALAVIALRWHYFTDTVAGAAVGLGTVCAVSLVLDSRFVRRLPTVSRREQPSPLILPSATGRNSSPPEDSLRK
jgi:membrane-associated phospholipid phosphatase